MYLRTKTFSLIDCVGCIHEQKRLAGTDCVHELKCTVSCNVDRQVVKAHTTDVARPCQIHSDQEEDYMAADITLENAIERQKLRIRARRASCTVDHQAPLPVSRKSSSLSLLH